MGVHARKAADVSIDDILKWACLLYDDTLFGQKTIYDGVVVGAPSGAVSHLASLLRYPFLTQHYLLAFKGHYAPDDSKAYFEDGVNLSKQVLKSNPGIEAIIHYDPLHDRFLITRVNFIRIKLRTLPEQYKEFIRENVKPGGAVVSVKCTYPWLMYPVGTESGQLFYQVGGLGDVAPEEYLNDSERLRKYRRQEGGNPNSPWGLQDIEPIESPESEWGSVGSLNDELEDFCRKDGFRLVEIDFPHPEGFSVLAFKAYKEALKLAQSEMDTVFFDCFTHINPRLNLITHTPSVWLPFICGDSFRFARRMANRISKDCRIWLSLHPSFCDPVDLTPIADWDNLFKGFKSYELLGVERDKYPADLSTYIDFAKSTERIAEVEKKSFALAIDAEILENLVADKQP